jgi:hypothetical protein
MALSPVRWELHAWLHGCIVVCRVGGDSRVLLYTLHCRHRRRHGRRLIVMTIAYNSERRYPYGLLAISIQKYACAWLFEREVDNEGNV